jgi:hypothetical protein
VVRERHGVQAHADVPVGLLRAVGERLYRLDLGLEADVSERLEEGLLVGRVRADHVRDSAHQRAVADRRLQQRRVVDVSGVEAVCRVIEVLGVGEDPDALGGVNVRHAA